MIQQRDPLFDQRVADWLKDDPAKAPARVLEAIVDGLPSVARRQAPRLPWRFRTERPAIRWPVAVAVMVGVVAFSGLLLALQLRVPAAGNPTGLPTPSLPVLAGVPTPSMPVVAPPTGFWTATGSMVRANTGHTATLLLDGRVLVAGGTGPDAIGPESNVTAELYDPRTGTWSATGNMITNRFQHTATLLPNGTVLVAGGESAGLRALASAELYDPSTGTWAATGNMTTVRARATATLLGDGRVLVAGGYGNAPSNNNDHSPEIVASAEIYDPSSGAWTPTGSMITPRRDHSATLLLDGTVLVAGGETNADVPNGLRGPRPQSTSELYDPATGDWASSGSMDVGFVDHGATLLLDGRVLVEYGDVARVDLYDPGSGSWASVAYPDIGGFVSATRLQDGTVLTTFQAKDVELYDPATSTWTYMNSGSTTFAAGETATLLDDGTVLLAGGGTNKAALYHPGSGK